MQNASVTMPCAAKGIGGCPLSPTSNVERRTSNVERRTLNVERQGEAGCRRTTPKRPTLTAFDVGRWTFDVRCSAFDVLCFGGLLAGHDDFVVIQGMLSFS